MKELISLLSTAVKSTVRKNTVLPILQHLLLTGKNAIVTDLETWVIIPYKNDDVGIGVCIEAKKFLEVLKTMKQHPSLKIEKKLKNIQVSVDVGNTHFKLSGFNIDQFPKLPVTDKYNNVGRFGSHEMELISNAFDFASTMTGILCGKKIVATDAHRLAHFKCKEKIDAEFILPAKSVKTLLSFGGEWDIKFNGINVCLTRDDGVQIISRVIDSKFPNYKVVFPKKKDMAASVLVDKELFISELTNARKFSNKNTSLVILTISDNKMTLHSENPDSDESYTNSIDVKSTFYNQNNNIMIGFNSSFLIEIAKKQKKNTVELKLWGQTKCGIVNNNYLVMPLMINNYTLFYEN